jgi:hypothetical protein
MGGSAPRRAGASTPFIKHAAGGRVSVKSVTAGKFRRAAAGKTVSRVIRGKAATTGRTIKWLSPAIFSAVIETVTPNKTHRVSRHFPRKTA